MMMKKYTLFVSLVCSSIFAVETNKESKIAYAKEVLSNLDETVAKYVAMLEVPGAVVGVVVEGEVVFAKPYGSRNVEKHLPTTTKTLFPIGSITKGFTSFLLGTLVDDNILQWDDLIIDHIPSFRLEDPYTTQEVTIKDYLTHVSGYPKNDPLWFNLNLSRKELIRKLRYLTPAFSFRSQFHYQNIGYAVAAYAAEQATQKSYEELLQERVLQPLGLHSTTASIEQFQKNDDYALGYRGFKAKDVRPSYLVNPHTIAAGGGLISNLEDMLTWTRGLLNYGNNLVERRTWHEIFTPHVTSNITSGFNLEEYIPMESYGLGWFLVPYRGYFMAFHGGNIEGYSSNIVLFPRDNIGIVVLTNKNFSPLPYLIATTFADKLLGLPEIDWAAKCNFVFEAYTKEELATHQAKGNENRVLNTTPTHALIDYEGSYTHPAFGKMVVHKKNNGLTLTYNNITMNLNHWHYNVFEIANDCPYSILVGLKFSFHQNVYGDISSIEVPLEPMSDDLMFEKEKDSSLNDPNYLDQFAGTYSYYGFSVPIERRDEKLVVKASWGQPEYTLIPEKFGLFKVVNQEGYLVQFLMDDNSRVTAVQVTQGTTSYIAIRH
ncbi:MAG: serine hydrolase [Verrucomicrobia bacterium]|nr:serine hydrolase [Verrucomicrobiota bacterium]